MTCAANRWCRFWRYAVTRHDCAHRHQPALGRHLAHFRSAHAAVLAAIVLLVAPWRCVPWPVRAGEHSAVRIPETWARREFPPAPVQQPPPPAAGGHRLCDRGV